MSGFNDGRKFVYPRATHADIAFSVLKSKMTAQTSVLVTTTDHVPTQTMPGTIVEAKSSSVDFMATEKFPLIMEDYCKYNDFIMHSFESTPYLAPTFRET